MGISYKAERGWQSQQFGEEWESGFLLHLAVGVRRLYNTRICTFLITTSLYIYRRIARTSKLSIATWRTRNLITHKTLV